MTSTAELFNPVRSLPFAYGNLDPSIVSEFVPLRASDGADMFGVLYYPKRTTPKFCFLAVHPRGDYSRFYAVPGLTAAGYAVLCLTTRYLNNDSDAQHERMLLDLAAGMRTLRDRGMETILLGNSGGGSLTSFYQSQAVLAGDARLASTPGGNRIPLAAEDMPLAVGQVQVAVHIGEGAFMRDCIDPAVVDESEPTASDPTLDMYEARNGRRPYPEPSSYDREWLAEYRRAQEARCARIDAIALGLIGDRREINRTLTDDARKASLAVERMGIFARYLVVYRTLANPFYLDPTIDPSDRKLGSSFTPDLDPIVGNYGLHGLGRLLTPRAWLSTWSPTYSQTSMLKNLPGYDLPSLFVNSTGDTEISIGEFDEIVAACHAKDVTVDTVRGDHYLNPLTEGDPDPRVRLDEIMVEWASSRFPL